MPDFIFTEKDRRQIEAHDLTKDKIYEQLQTFTKGIPYIELAEAATIGNGIFKIDQKDCRQFTDLYNSTPRETVKFVPASGSATRMFKDLHQFMHGYNREKTELNTFLEKAHLQHLKPLFEQLEELPFYAEVKEAMNNHYANNAPASPAQSFYDFTAFLLDEMAFDELPKGLIPFHRYPDKTTTAFEEHLYEAAQYTGDEKTARIHLTVAEEHLEKFKQKYETIKSRVEEKTEVSFKVHYSFQKKSTDTIAVHQDDTPFRLHDGRLYFRPGGHGALIENLNSIEGDIVFIKNIDNVQTLDKLTLLTTYKKTLGGILILAQEKVFNILTRLDQEEFSTNLQKDAETLAQKYFGVTKEFNTPEALRLFFDRPIRVCGMVENKGEPGGGPFWVNNHDGSTSLQIVEKAQINPHDKEQVTIGQKATHFNPVDIVCGLKNYKGKKFNLHDFRNPHEGFIAHKTHQGKPLKALELPGLWNGGMAYWNSIFVEVPLTTFNPVKTVLDLLKTRHRIATCS